MNLQLPRRLLVAALLAAGAMSSAQAVNYVEIDGANVKFFYDADYWGLGSASVTGDSISFSISDDFSVFAKIGLTGNSASGHDAYTNTGVVAVAKNGYAVTGAMNVSATSTYSFTTGFGTTKSEVAGALYGGTYSGGVFNQSYLEDYFYKSETINSSDSTPVDLNNPHSGSSSFNTVAGWAGNHYSAVAVDTQLAMGVTQQYKGRTDGALTNVGYSFSVVAVPEPETYAMLIAGLGLVGFAARRKKSQAA